MTLGTLILALVLILPMPIEGHSKGILAAVVVILHGVALAVDVFFGGWPCSAG